MSTFPSSDASSPTPTKVTSASATIASAGFTPPVRSCLVVSITSDADVATGAAPTISHTGGASITWTRVGPALGFSSTGDVGIVAVFQGVFTDLASPPGSRAAMTVTVGGLPTASKPKLLIPRVYPEDQVDITDPIGATAGGSFATGTLITGTITPETSEGGVRMVQLDWSATGVPTTFLPNNDNTEIVDSFHNAGLSTNLAIGGDRRTRAGVDEAMGSRLLASATDGNWLIYELRGPQPVAGSAIDSTAFDTAFDTGTAGSTPGAGAGTGSWSFAGAGSGKRAPRATGAGTFALVGTSTGKRPPKASATGSWSTAGTASGSAPAVAGAAGSGSGTLAFAGTSSGKRTVRATAAGTVTFTGTASGKTIRRGSGSGAVAFAGSATGKRTPKATGNATLAFVGSATGRRSPKSGGTGSYAYAGSATGSAPVVGQSDGNGSGSWTFAGSATGKRSPKGGGSSAFAYVGSGTGARPAVGVRAGSGSGAWSLSGQAVGRRAPRATGAGLLTLVATAIGTQPLDPDFIPPELEVGPVAPPRFTAAAARESTVTATRTGHSVSAGPARPHRYRRQQ